MTNTLAEGFLEKVYENALAAELRMADLAVEHQHGITLPGQVSHAPPFPIAPHD